MSTSDQAPKGFKSKGEWGDSALSANPPRSGSRLTASFQHYEILAFTGLLVVIKSVVRANARVIEIANGWGWVHSPFSLLPVLQKGVPLHHSSEWATFWKVFQTLPADIDWKRLSSSQLEKRCQLWEWSENGEDYQETMRMIRKWLRGKPVPY